MAPAVAAPVPARVLVAVLVALLVGAGPLALGAMAAERDVEVRGGGYAPAEVIVRVGDTVTWTWATTGHSVTHQPAEGQSRAFDSHPDCSPLVVGCGQQGEAFAHTFDEPGTYAYASRMDPGVTGRIVVEPAPTPSETSPPPTGSGSPTSPAGPEDADSPSEEAPGDSPDDGGSTSTPRQARPRQLSAGEAGDDDGAPAPEVAPSTASDEPGGATTSPVPEPSFDPFLEATDPPTRTEVPGDVAVGDDDGGRTARVVWGVLGGVTLLGTVGAFSRTVLFGDPWSGG